MCGITGFTWEDKALVSEAVKTIRYRGPEKLASYVGYGVSLGHARLRIIDLSVAADQPMVDREGNVIVFNGEIYNFASVKEELERSGARFSTHSDTEVLLAAWRTWGKDCLHKLNGMWAFAVLEPGKQRLTLVRDRYGVKPLYYSLLEERSGKKQLVFGSEIIAVRTVRKSLGLNPEVSQQGLADFLALRHTLDQTLFSGIMKVPQGSLLSFDLNKGISIIERWYTLPEPEFLSTSAVLSQLPRILKDSVRLRMIADVPVGFFLSGGIDSGLVTQLAVERKRALGERSDSIKTYSVGFSEADELPQARFMAEHLGTHHTELVVSSADINKLGEVVAHMGEPVGDAAYLPTYLIAKKAKEQVTCVQAGEGADELFGGYDRYKFIKYGRHLAAAAALLPISKHPIYKRLAGLHGKKLAEQITDVNRLFQQGSISKLDGSSYRKYASGKSVLQAVSRFDLQTVLPNDFFMKADLMPMAHALEEREPYMDQRLVELALATPDNAKLRFLTGKWVLRKAFPQLPRPVRNRKKRGYNVPADVWFGANGVLREQLAQFLDKPDHNYYDVSKAREILARYSPKASHVANYHTTQQLFSLLVFELWHKEVFT